MTAGRAAAICAGAALAVSLPTLRNGFAIDDAYQIVRNPALASLGNVPSFFTGYWGQASEASAAHDINTRYYRPVAVTVSALEVAVFGLRPAGFHLASGLLHAAAAALCALIAFRVTRRTGAALVAGLLFAVHPVQAEAIAPACYQTTLLAGVLGGAALLTFGRALDEGPRPRLLLVMGVSLLAACLSKEDAFAVPLLAAAWAVILRPPGWRRALGAGGAVMAAAVLVALAARAAVVVPSRMTYFADSPASTVAFTMVRVASLYAELLLVPLRLCPFYDWFIIPYETGPSAAVALGAAVIVSLVAAVVVLARRHPPAALGLAWLLLGLAPVSHVIPIIIVAAERFLYIPLLGVSLAAGAALTAALDRAGGRRRAVAAAGALVLAALATRTLIRLPDWHDDETLNRATARTFPETPTPLLNLADHYRMKGDRARAEEALLEAARRAPGWSVPLERLARLRAGQPP